jgi:predicted PurR-regulated permease PerM
MDRTADRERHGERHTARERRKEALGRVPLARLHVAEVRRAFVTTVLFAVVVALFAVMVHEVFVAAILGAVIGVYLRPVFRFIEGRTGRPALAAVLTLVLLLVPILVVLVYGYLEVRSAAEYLDANTDSVASQIDAALGQLPFVGQTNAQAAIAGGLNRAADFTINLPSALQEAVAAFAVDASVFLFTAFYVFTGADEIVAYLRSKVPVRYAELAERIEGNVQGVLYGAIYGTLITQTLKSAVVFALALVFGVPLAAVLALASFVIGFFPVVGSWSVYVPAAIYLLVFQDAPWEAAGMVAGGLLVNTVLFSLVIRPKLAAKHSKVLNFYWMFIALIAGVYAFGVPGIVLGPILVGLLKAVFDTVTTDLSWNGSDGDGDGEDDETPEAEVLAEEELASAQGEGSREGLRDGGA